jgi:protein PhnA
LSAEAPTEPETAAPPDELRKRDKCCKPRQMQRRPCGLLLVFRASRVREGTIMADNDDYIYDEVTGEWRPASEMAAEAAAANTARDASGNVLADGDSVVLIKDLKVKGAGQTLKQGTVIKSIRLTDNPEEIDCRHDAIKGLVLRTEFVRKR